MATQPKFVPVKDRLASIKRQFGDKVQDKLIHRLHHVGLLKQEQGESLLASQTIQSAQKDISGLVQRAINGSPQAIGGFKQVEPVLVFTLDSLADLIQELPQEQSMADLLPSTLPPLEDNFEVSNITPQPKQRINL